MLYKIIARNGARYRTYVGGIVTWGPSTVNLLLTEPYSDSGRIVAVDLVDVVVAEQLDERPRQDSNLRPTA